MHDSDSQRQTDSVRLSHAPQTMSMRTTMMTGYVSDDSEAWDAPRKQRAEPCCALRCVFEQTWRVAAAQRHADDDVAQLCGKAIRMSYTYSCVLVAECRRGGKVERGPLPSALRDVCVLDVVMLADRPRSARSALPARVKKAGCALGCERVARAAREQDGAVAVLDLGALGSLHQSGRELERVHEQRDEAWRAFGRLHLVRRRRRRRRLGRLGLL